MTMQNKSTHKKRSVLLGALLILLAPCISSCGDKPQKSKQQIEKELQALNQAFLQKYPQGIAGILQLHKASDPAFADQARQFCKDYSVNLQKGVSLMREAEKLTTDPSEKKELQQVITMSEQYKNSCDNLVQERDAAKLAKALEDILKDMS